MGLNKETRKELKIKKLVGKAAEIHKQNVAYGKENTQKGIDKMVSGGEHYARLVSRIRRLDPTGGVIEEWLLKGAFIVTANFGSLDWAASEFVEIALTIRYDYAILNF